MSSETAAAPEERIIKTRGIKIPLHPDLQGGGVRRSLRQDRYEYRESEAVLRMVGADDVVLELGGGIGYMSTLMAVKCQPKEIHTYEANPGLIPWIRRAHELNDVTNVTVHNKLLAAKKSDPVDFFVRENFLASSMDRDSDPASVIAVEKIEVDALTSVLKALKPTVLVCDIEGAEAHLLPAADFTGLRGAVIELHPQWIRQEGVQAVFDAMHRAGLTFFPWTSNKKVAAFKKGW